MKRRYLICLQRLSRVGAASPLDCILSDRETHVPRATIEVQSMKQKWTEIRLTGRIMV